MAKTLYLHTLFYPFGRREAYLEAEVKLLSQHFEKVIVLPLETVSFDGSIGKRDMPENFECFDLYGADSNYSGSARDRLKIFIRARKKINFLKDWRYQFSYCGELSRKSDILQQFLENRDEGFHYSYWFNDWATILSLLNKKGLINSFISRAHGFDLFEEREKLGYQPWRMFQLENCSKVFSVSNVGRDYLSDRYPKFTKKIETSYLGTIDHGLGAEQSGSSYHICTCSAIIPLKRIERMLDILEFVTEKVHWTHIGFGPNIDELKGRATNLPANISCDFLGSKSNAEVMGFYKNTSLDCFVNLSETEGLPVAMMEAISFGIPIFATNVGGVAEIVTEKTGELISVNFENENFALRLSKFLVDNSTGNNRTKEIREFWENNFSAENNYQDFCKRILRINAV